MGLKDGYFHSDIVTVICYWAQLDRFFLILHFKENILPFQMVVYVSE